MNQQISLSVVVPVYNEADNIRHLFDRIKSVCETGMDGVPFDYEIIIVNDGSKDRTDQVCRELSPVTYIRFRKNFGQTSALDCGFHRAKKELVAALDGDGQNDPQDIPKMIRYLQERKLDVVSGWRKERHDSWMKRALSRGATFLRYLIIHDGIHDSGCTLKIYRRECFNHLTLYGEQHRFIPALLKIRGFRIGEIEVSHHPRENGRSKYSITRVYKGFLDLLSVWFWSKYASRPLHLMGGISLLFFIGGFLFGSWALIGYLLTGNMTDFIVQLILTIFFLTAGQLQLTFGLMGEMLMRTYYNTTENLPYSIQEIVVLEEEDREPGQSGGEAGEK